MRKGRATFPCSSSPALGTRAQGVGDKVELRFYIDPETDRPHIWAHSVTEEEVTQVMRAPLEDRAGREGSRVALGQTAAGR